MPAHHPPGHHGSSGSAADFTHVLILDPDLARGLRLGKALRAGGRVRATVMPRAAEEGARGRGGSGGAAVAVAAFDVAVVALELPPQGGLAAARELLRVNAAAEIVFFATDARSPELHAARALGVARVIPVDGLAAWLSEAAPLLGQAARARRTLAHCLGTLPPLPEPPSPAARDARLDEAAAPALPLHEAERRFREAYLARVLAQAPTRAQAAARAGVPYRTLTQMISKLGLRGRS